MTTTGQKGRPQNHDIALRNNGHRNTHKVRKAGQPARFISVRNVERIPKRQNIPVARRKRCGSEQLLGFKPDPTGKEEASEHTQRRSFQRPKKFCHPSFGQVAGAKSHFIIGIFGLSLPQNDADYFFRLALVGPWKRAGGTVPLKEFLHRRCSSATCRNKSLYLCN